MGRREELNPKHRDSEDEPTAREFVALASFRCADVVDICGEVPVDSDETLAM
jgi:hypothetical protein